MTEVDVKIRQLPHADGLEPPRYETADASGMDMRAAVTDERVLQPGEYACVPTGCVIELPRGYEGQVRARSGLAVRHGIGVVNAPGTIDADYRGEIGVILINHGREPFVISRGMRIAQLVVAPVCRAEVRLATELSETARAAGGFGHTGT